MLHTSNRKLKIMALQYASRARLFFKKKECNLFFFHSKAKAYLTLVLQTGMAQNIVFKMPFVQNLFALDKAMETHKTVEFAQHLAADDFAATVELGKILAVDLFIGNDDRFDDTGALVNPGNVL